jgi:hypothetical protein
LGPLVVDNLASSTQVVRQLEAVKGDLDKGPIIKLSSVKPQALPPIQRVRPLQHFTIVNVNFVIFFIIINSSTVTIIIVMAILTIITVTIIITIITVIIFITVTIIFIITVTIIILLFLYPSSSP